MELKTPLYDCHVAAGGKIVPFAGYLLPVQYTGVIKEHMAVRTACGLFDVSHMGEFLIKGADALNNVQNLFCNDFENMYDGQVRYSPMCNDKGGVVDDLIVYRIRSDCYMMVVNAANHDKDAAWISSHLTGDVKFDDWSERIAQVALQGPQSEAILEKLCVKENIPPKYYTFTKDVDVAGCRSIVSRTGYTPQIPDTRRFRKRGAHPARAAFQRATERSIRKNSTGIIRNARARRVRRRPGWLRSQ